MSVVTKMAETPPWYSRDLSVYLRLLENAFLRLILTMGWMSGVMPIRNPLGALGDYGTWPLMYWYSWAQVLFSLTTGTIFVIGNEAMYRIQKLSEFLPFFGMAIIFYSTDLFRRAFALINYGEMREVLRTCHGIETRSPRILFLAFVTLFMHVTKRVAYISSFYFGKNAAGVVFGQATWMDWFIYCTNLLSDVITSFTGYFTIGFTILMGSRLVVLFQRLGKEFERDFTGDSRSPKGLGSFRAKFKDLKRKFVSFNHVAGTYVLILVTYSSFSFVNYLHDVFQPEEMTMYGKVADVLGVFESVILVGTLSHIGYYMKFEIRNVKDEIQDELLNIQFEQALDERVLLMANSILDWNWEFTAKHYFSVNHGLLPAICGTILSYVIVLFQLKMSE